MVAQHEINLGADRIDTPVSAFHHDVASVVDLVSVVPAAAFHAIGAASTVEAVCSVAATQHIVALQAGQTIVACPTLEAVAARIPPQHIVVIGTNGVCRTDHDLLTVHHCACFVQFQPNTSLRIAKVRRYRGAHDSWLQEYLDMTCRLIPNGVRAG